MLKINKIILIISVIIYIIFFCKLGNTCLRINSEGVKKFSIIPLITEGFIGPIRTLLITLFNNGIIPAFKYFRHELTNLANPFSAYLFVYGIFNILVKNKIIQLKEYKKSK
jgi:hypothetical protein